MSKIKLGMIGAGMVGQLAHIANFKQLPNCEIRALAELRPSLGQLAADKFAIPKLYRSHHDLLGDKEIEALIVVTHRPATGPIVLDCLNSGRHVLTEKPMAHTVEQALKLLKAAEAKKVLLSVGFMKRFDPGLQLAKKLFDQFMLSKELGDVQLLRIFCYGGEFASASDNFVMTDEPRPKGLEVWPIGPDWLSEDKHQDYAWFLNVFCHNLNLLRYFMGETPEVMARDLRRPKGRLVMFKGKEYPAILEMTESSFHDWREGLEIVFDKGSLNVRFHSPLLKNQPAEVLLVCNGREEKLFPGWGWAFKNQAQAFIEDIRDLSQPLNNCYDALEDLKLMEAIWS